MQFIALQEINNFARSLDEESFNEFVNMFKKFKSDIEQQRSEVNSEKIQFNSIYSNNIFYRGTIFNILDRHLSNLTLVCAYKGIKFKLNKSMTAIQHYVLPALEH